MALPVNRDVDIYRGDPYDGVYDFVLPNTDPVDISGGDPAATVEAQWRADPDDPDSAAVAFSTAGSDPVTGHLEVHLTAAQTAVLPLLGGYDVQVTASGVPATWVWGRARCTKDYTHGA